MMCGKILRPVAQIGTICGKIKCALFVGRVKDGSDCRGNFVKIIH